MTTITAGEREHMRKIIIAQRLRPDQTEGAKWLDELVTRLLDALEEAEAQLVSCRESENGSLERCDVLQHQLAAAEQRAERAGRAAKALAERFPDCPSQDIDFMEFTNDGVAWPNWCECKFDSEGCPLGCSKSDWSDCWLQWAAEAAKE